MNEDKGMRLNKYLAHAGVASRRKADELISEGLVKVNGKVVREMGHRVQRGDKVTFEGRPVKPEKKVYILLNKPKNVISSASDEKGRKTVVGLVRKASNERIYPVGRLDRNTTGLLLLTNDGELAKKLTHPSHKVTKVYLVKLDKPLSKEDMERIIRGVELEEGVAKVDEIAFPDPSDKTQVGIELHIGWNRVIRRIFETLGYDVKHLDRVLFAGLTKKNLPRGKWRHLSEREVLHLKHFK